MAQNFPVEQGTSRDNPLGIIPVLPIESYWSALLKRGRLVTTYDDGTNSYTTSFVEVTNLIGLELGKYQIIKELIISTTTDAYAFIRHDYGDFAKGVDGNTFDIVFDGYIKAGFPLHLKFDGDFVFLPGDEVKIFLQGIAIGGGSASGGNFRQMYKAVSLPYMEN